MRPSRGVWIAWTLVLVGGLAVLAAAGLLLLEACPAACPPGGFELAGSLAVGGTAVAITGGLAAAYLTLRQ